MKSCNEPQTLPASSNSQCVKAGSKPQTPNPKPQTPNPKPQTPNPKPQTPNPKPQTPNPKPQTPNPKPQTPNPKPQTPNPASSPPRRGGSPLAWNSSLMKTKAFVLELTQMFCESLDYLEVHGTHEPYKLCINQNCTYLITHL